MEGWDHQHKSATRSKPRDGCDMQGHSEPRKAHEHTLTVNVGEWVGARAQPALTSVLNINRILLEKHHVSESCHRLGMTHWYVWVFLWCLSALMTVDRWEDLLNLPNELQLTCTVIVFFINLVAQY